MGSGGREEICPYSDLEFMILIRDKTQAPYFKKLVTILEIQIASLGETQRFSFSFTCLEEPNTSGLHIDNSPTQEERLIQTPDAMAQIQRCRKTGEVSGTVGIEYSILKTTSLAQRVQISTQTTKLI